MSSTATQAAAQEREVQTPESPIIRPGEGASPEEFLEAISVLAYAFWEARRDHDLPGSADEDWFRAEREFRNS
ncbi:MAG: DUF2934 domain-containing protein [Acidobacteriota bacterium]